MSASNASCDSIKLFGKQRETALLAETAESDRLPHGIMLTGEKGIGKRTFAKWCAMLYLCREPENNMPCGRCRSCRNIISGEHADVIYAKGEKYSKESVRDNVCFASTLPNDSDTRVFIYEDCEEMTEEQQNVLLKAIEEPSKYNRYIFTCSNTSQILETIKSRLVCIPISDMTAEECVSCLETGNYAEGFDFVIKRYMSDCYNLRDDPDSKYYRSRSGKPALIVLCTHWHDARTVYNESVRKLAAKWGLPLVKFDANIGFSRHMPHPVTGGQISLIYADDTQVVNGVRVGWHPLRGKDQYIQRKMAAIFAARMSQLLP